MKNTDILFPEPLEARRLLAADFYTVSRTGTLTLIGTPADDRFVISATEDREMVQIAYGTQTDLVQRFRFRKLTFDGGAGNDYVELQDPDNLAKSTLRGGEGRDTLIGSAYLDLIFGGPGADLLKGGNQSDTIHGEGGNDRMFGNNSNDQLFGGAGDDKINAGPGNDFVNGGRGNDRLTASGQDTVFGGAGTDSALDFSGLVHPPDGVEFP